MQNECHILGLATFFILCKKLYTIAIGLRYFMGTYATDYGPLFAGYTIASIPLVLLFLLTMRHFIAGLTSGAIKA